jgi:UMF1 family MFS transporter
VNLMNLPEVNGHSGPDASAPADRTYRLPTTARHQPTFDSPAASQPAKVMLWKLGLHRPELRAWAMYDWANSAFVTTIITAVFPIYFSSVASAGMRPESATSRYGLATTLGLVIIAVASPILGAIADFRPIKKRLLGSFLALGVITTSLMFFI